MNRVLEQLNHLLGRMLPRRIPLLYLILTVLLLLSVVPLLVFGLKVSSRNRQELQTNQQVLQSTVTSAIAEEIRLYVQGIDGQVESLIRMLEITGAIGDVADPNYAGALDRSIHSFVGGGDNVRFLTIVNAEQRGRQGGVPEVGQDDFIRQQLSKGFQAAHLGNAFHSGSFLVHSGGRSEPVMVMARPLTVRNDFRGMVAIVVSLEFLREQLKKSPGGLVTYVVNREGRLILYPDEKSYTVGQDMSGIEIVQSFLTGTEQAIVTTTFDLEQNNEVVKMLGTQAPVPALNWAVIAQKPLDEAYAAVYEMDRYAFMLGFIAIVLSLAIGYYSARRLTTPIQMLAESTRVIAKGDFSRRVHLSSRTEIGELADTFNLMTADLERYVERLKQAAQENHELFLGSIRTLAAAIDEKDPYTRGHSDRVARYSVILAEAMGLPEDDVYKIRISALLHDVGKIGIDDRILKKPTGLTAEEFEVMKQHPVKGANIIRPVGKLREMIPGIELHHESMNGRGYPYGLKGEEIPMMARVIMVADTLDAMTTHRPYQSAMDMEVALEKITAIQGTKFDPAVVQALIKSVEARRLKLTPQMVEV